VSDLDLEKPLLAAILDISAILILKMFMYREFFLTLPLHYSTIMLKLDIFSFYWPLMQVSQFKATFFTDYSTVLYQERQALSNVA
jgi:hypothetical protein